MLELNFMYHSVAQKLNGLHVWLHSIFFFLFKKYQLQAFDIAYF